MLSGAGGFDGGVQGQQVGLIGNAGHGLDDFGNGGGLAFQFLDHLDRRDLALGSAADGVNGVGNLERDVLDQSLQCVGF